MTICSCGRAGVELGCDLCAQCRREYEESQAAREQYARDHDAQEWEQLAQEGGT